MLFSAVSANIISVLFLSSTSYHCAYLLYWYSAGNVFYNEREGKTLLELRPQRDLRKLEEKAGLKWWVVAKKLKEQLYLKRKIQNLRHKHNLFSWVTFQGIVLGERPWISFLCCLASPSDNKRAIEFGKRWVLPQ